MSFVSTLLKKVSEQREESNFPENASPASPTSPAPTPGTRDFLPRPLGQEDNPALWDAWTPLMLWLLEFHPDRYHEVCEAEEAIRAAERAGITAGEEYEQVCAGLLRKFAAARRLCVAARVKVWLQ